MFWLNGLNYLRDLTIHVQAPGILSWVFLLSDPASDVPYRADAGLDGKGDGRPSWSHGLSSAWLIPCWLEHLQSEPADGVSLAHLSVSMLLHLSDR